MKRKFTKPIDLNDFNRTSSWRKDIAKDQQRIAKKMFSNTKKIYNCPICNSTSRELFVTIYEYLYFECINCEHLYCGTPPDENELEKLYNSKDDKAVESIQGKIYMDSELFNKRIDIISFPKAKFATDLIEGKGKWVDLGAGVGDLVISSKKLGWDSIGYESDLNEVNFGLSKGAKLKNEYIDFKSSSNILNDARVVSMINVLEHISDPLETVLNISKSIRKEAYFLFEVPRFPSISSLTNRCFPELAARNIYSPDHLHLFSDKSIKIILDQANLEIISTWFFGQDAFELIGNTLCHGDFQSHNLVHQTNKLVNDFQSIIDRNELSDTMLILSRKR